MVRGRARVQRRRAARRQGVGLAAPSAPATRAPSLLLSVKDAALAQDWFDKLLTEDGATTATTTVRRHDDHDAREAGHAGRSAWRSSTARSR